MNTKDASRAKTALWKKPVSLVLGLFLALALLEIGLRFNGWVASSLQEFGNLRSLRQNGSYRILCLGESTTQKQYPQILERILNQRNIGVRFSVIDRGKSGTNTPAILNHIEAYLAEYHPDMVIAMMGNNDEGITYYRGIPDSLTWMFRHCRVYRFIRILWMQFWNKVQKTDIDRPESHPENEAIELRNRIAREPGNDKAYVELGRFYQFRNKLFQAEMAFKKATELNPKNDDAYVALGIIFEEQDQLSQAESVFKKAIELNPENHKARTELKRLHQYQDQSLKTEETLKKAVKLNPKDDKAYAALGGLSRDQGKFQQAREFYKKAVEINPSNDAACVELGRLYRSIGQWRLAEDFLKKAVESNPKNDMAYVELGRLYRDQGNPSLAETPFKKALDANPENFSAFFELGVLYRDEGRLALADESFKRALTISPHDERTLGAMASLYDEMGKRELAQECAQKAGLSGSKDFSAVTARNYRRLKEILDQNGIKLVCVQYPVRNVGPLKRIFGNDEGVIFVDNEQVFKTAIRRSGYKEFFRDMFAGDFGHCTEKGNELLAENIANVILKEVFYK